MNVSFITLDAMKLTDMIDRLQLNKLHGHKWHIQPVCAMTGDGIHEAFESMSNLIKEYNKSRPAIKFNQ